MSTVYNFEILIKSFIRFKDLERLLNSIERYYPNAIVRIVDDSPTLNDGSLFNNKEQLHVVVRQEKQFERTIKNKDNVYYYKLPFDSGLSKGRNYLLDRCKTKYFVMMEDDFEVTNETRLHKLERVIESNHNIIIAAGGTIEIGNPWRKGKWQNVGEMRKEGNYLIRYRYGKNAPTEMVNGISCISCGYTQNFFMGNLKLFNECNIRWEESLKIVFEHGYFFYTLPGNLKVYFVTDVWIKHHWSRPGIYKKYRVRMHPTKGRVPGLKRDLKKDKVIYD